MNAAGLAPGSYSGAVTVTAAGASNSPQSAAVTLTVHPFASGSALVSGNNQTAAASAALGQPLVVKATTQDSSGAAGVQVKFTLLSQPAGATGAALSVTTATTDSQGQAQSVLTLGNQPGTYRVEVVVAGLTHQTVVFTATATATVGALSAPATAVSAAPSIIAADGSSRALVTVIPRDASGWNLGPGQTVVLSRTGSGTLSAVTDRGDGSYTATLTAPATAGSAAVSATVNGTAIPQTTTVSFVVPVLVSGGDLTQGGSYTPGGYMFSMAIDSSDNVYVAHEWAIARIDAVTGAASTITGLLGATADRSGEPVGVALDRLGTLYYTRWTSGEPATAGRMPGRILKRDALSGESLWLAGTGIYGVGVEEGPALQVALYGNYAGPYRLATDKSGNLYTGDSDINRVRKLEAASGLISTVAGTANGGFGGDGGPARQALLSRPTGVAVDDAGNVYIADQQNHRIRKVDAATGIITTVAGNGAEVPPGTPGLSGDGGPATAATLNRPGGVALDKYGNLYIADGSDQYNVPAGRGRIRKVDAATGIITTVAGGGTGGLGSAATSADIGYPHDLVVDSSGSIYFLSRSQRLIPGRNALQGHSHGASGAAAHCAAAAVVL